MKKSAFKIYLFRGLAGPPKHHLRPTNVWKTRSCSGKCFWKAPKRPERIFLEGRPLTGQAWTLKPLRLGASKGLLPRFGPQTAYSVLEISRAV